MAANRLSPSAARCASLLLSATVVSVICLGSVVIGFWIFKVSGSTGQIAVQVPIALLAGIAGMICWFWLFKRFHRLEPGRDYLLVTGLSFPICAVVLTSVHYLVTGYLTSFGNIAGAWYLLFGQCLIAAPVAAALVRRTTPGQEADGATLG